MMWFSIATILVALSHFGSAKQHGSDIQLLRHHASKRKTLYRGKVHVVSPNQPDSRYLKTGSGVSIKGTVFEDINGDGVQQDNEPGIPDVMVSDGRNVVLTSESGEYRLPQPSAEDEVGGFSIFITKPDGYLVPLSENNVPQFSYMHKPEGTPLNIRGEPFRYGGLEATGPLPEEINFPLMKTETKDKFKIIVSGDPQTYSNNELGYLRDSLIKELSCMENEVEAIIFEGDVLGDELSLYKRFREVVSVADVPQYYVAGNHDYDFDSPLDIHSFDTFRREFGPEYYSFEIGQVHFIVLDDVFYPCTSEDNIDGLHDFCEVEGDPSYNGRITSKQIEWLKNDLAFVPKDKLIFLQMHIPIHSFIDQNLVTHMVDNVIELYEAIGCKRSADGTFKPEDCERPIISLGAHTHTNENILPGEDFEGWRTALQDRAPGPPPFHQLVCGAASGSWWSGDFNDNIVPESFQRLGSPKGYFIFEFDGPSYMETFKVPDKPADMQMSLDILTPAFRDWYNTLKEWVDTEPGKDDIPPVNINDLPDTKIVTTAEHSDTVLSANIWNGSRGSVVTASFDHGEEIPMVRTQSGEGENILETLDPFALKREMMTARYAYVSSSNEPRASGLELFRKSIQCPGDDPTACTPRPLSSSRWTNKSNHIWQVAIPEDLGVGPHCVHVTFTDHYGREYSSSMAFEIMEERPPKFFKDEKWDVYP